MPHSQTEKVVVVKDCKGNGSGCPTRRCERTQEVMCKYSRNRRAAMMGGVNACHADVSSVPVTEHRLIGKWTEEWSRHESQGIESGSTQLYCDITVHTAVSSQGASPSFLNI